MAALLLLAAGAARAEVRIVVAVGADTGLAEDVRLRHAQQDARRVASVLSDLGGATHTHLVPGPDTAAIEATLRLAREEAAAARRRGERTLLLFYFSGHGDREFLHARRTRVAWERLRALLREVDADTTVSFVDACASGGATPKGATPGEPFAVERDTSRTKGMVWFNSSRGGEASYESDELGGSFFTHYLVSALRGAADLDENGKVTLNEVYQFTYHQTVTETSLRLRAVQHPTFDLALAGEGEVVLTDLPLSRASLVLPRELEGVFFVSRRFGPHRNTIEVAKQPGTLSRLGVGEGTYLVYRRDDERVWLASYELPVGAEVVVARGDLKPRRYESVASKGGPVSLETWRAHAWGGAAGPAVKGAGALAPAVTVGLTRREGSLGLGLELTHGRFQFDAMDTRVENLSYELVAKAEAFHETRLGVLSAGLGLGGLLLQQSPRDAERETSISPGILAGAALEHRIFSKVSLRADGALATWFVRPEGSSGFSARLSPRFGLGLSVELR